MNDLSGVTAEPTAQPGSAFTFTGTWREFLPIAVTNLLLTIVTLGIYRFWAKARERRYLWSRTRFIDDHFEWTGTGKEMLLGFIIVFAILLPVLFGIQMAIGAMLARGDVAAGLALAVISYVGLFYLIGVAAFRALRYRLSRSWWHGIRGGSEDGGWSYGLSFMWKSVAGLLPFGLLVPWSMTSLWNDRWNKMSFGQHEFEARAESGGLMGRWLAIYLVPVIGGVVFFLGARSTMQGAMDGGTGAGGAVTMFAAVLFIYIGFLLASLSYYAAFFRQVAGATSIAGIEFEFTARSKDWLLLILGNIALVIVTLGIGALFLSYRNWSFIVRHMEASGELDLDRLLQSRTAATGDAEGLADVFDVGAI